MAKDVVQHSNQAVKIVSVSRWAIIARTYLGKLTPAVNANLTSPCPAATLNTHNHSNTCRTSYLDQLFGRTGYADTRRRRI